MANTRIPWLIVGYGITLMVLTLLAHWAAPGGQSTAMLTGTVGGALCVLIGTLGLMGWRYRPWAILVLGAVGYILLSQVVIGWMGDERRSSDGILAPAILTATLILSIGLVAYVAQAGTAPLGRPQDR